MKVLVYRVIVLSSLIFVQPCFADAMVTFKVGSVQVKQGGKTSPVQIGQTLKANALIITNDKARVSLRHASGKILKVMPGSSVKIADLLKGKNGPGVRTKILISKGFSNQPVPVAAGGVRANEEGKVEVLWDDDPFSEAPVEWSNQWQQLKNGEYYAVKKASSNARDAEGMYLNAIASYQLAGFSDAKQATKKLQKAKQMASYPELKDLCLKLQITINFKNGYFKEAYAYSKEFTRFKKNKEIEETIYYMYAASAEMAAPLKEYQDIKKKFAKAFPGSSLLNELN